jgi:hypothetical protein
MEKEKRGVAVVELFTSEGCSSCPPADAVLRAVADRADVYALSFHVDYWNDLGWADPWSTEAFTERQQRYARALGGGVFTPEMIVNGARGFLGSDETRAESAIDDALARPAEVSLSLHVEESRGAWRVRYEATPAPPGATLAIALVDRSHASDVVRGENAGRTLVHANVVRAFRSAPLSERGEETIAMPDAASDGREVIAFVESPSMEILGAARAYPGI